MHNACHNIMRYFTDIPTEPPQPTCTMGKVYEQCGTACPLTCANRNNPPTNCIDECVSGCFCPQGVLQYDGRCVTESECPPGLYASINQLLSSFRNVIISKQTKMKQTKHRCHAWRSIECILYTGTSLIG